MAKVCSANYKQVRFLTVIHNSCLEHVVISTRITAQ